MAKRGLELSPVTEILIEESLLGWKEFTLPAQHTRYCIDGTASFTLDFHSGERRYGTSKDIELALRIFQKMDMGVMAWAPTCAEEKPARVRALYEFFNMARFSSKHGEH